MNGAQARRSSAGFRATTLAGPPVFVIAEAVGAIGDEGYRIFALELARALARRGPIRAFTAAGHPESGMQPIARTPLILLGPALITALRRERPTTIIYLAKSSLTLPALLRARLLKWASGGAITIMVALQARDSSWLTRLLARRMWPDLLLVTSESERLRATRMGANASCIHPGVDLVRFHRPLPGEKAALRQKWRLPVDGHIVLHVGHLKMGRNLQALYPLASVPGVSVVVLASSRRERTSAALRDDLIRHGIIVLDGYRSDVAELYRLADCYVFPVQSPDWAISVPLSVIEAIASGLPIVTARFGALPELFINVAGVQFIDRPEEEVAAAVIGALNDPGPSHNLLDGWSWDEVADRLLVVREEAIQRGGAR